MLKNDLIKTPEDKALVNQNVYGIEKKPLPHLLCMTNMLLHNIDEPNILHGNSLEKNVREYKEDDKFDVIMMNPPYGGTEGNSIKSNFPVEMQSSETADLFMALILYRLKNNGRCGVVLPDNFLFGEDNARVAIKEKLLNECNLHTIVRLPHGVFAPYTDITTNLLFFDKTCSTKDIWFFEHPLPIGYKNYTKTKPIRLEEFNLELDWWDNRVEHEFAWKVSIDEIKERKYNLDIKNPNKIDEALEDKSSIELLKDFKLSCKRIMDIIDSLEKELDHE